MFGHTNAVLARKRGTTTSKKSGFRITLLLRLVFILTIIVWLIVSANLVLSPSPTDGEKKSTSISVDTSRNPNNLRQQRQRQQQQKAKVIVNNNKQGSEEFDTIVNMLVTLARMPVEELKPLLEGANDPFHLEALANGQCPYSSRENVEWLPDRPVRSRDASQWYKEKSSENHVVVYYEHLSKAGGTSFCKLAQTNMPKKEVPAYYCMPSEPGMVDARVGSWNTTKLQTYAKNKPNHRLLSNEWEPFNLEFMKSFQPTMSSSSSSFGSKDNDPTSLSLLFVTSIRNPINRLLSAYKFWGILHNGKPTKPTLEQFLKRYGNRAKRWKILSGDFNANVARFNFATWKFSGGELPVSKRQLDAEAYLTNDNNNMEDHDEDVWLKPFETSVRTLSKFDLAIPMEYLSIHTAPLTELMGWTDFDKSHVVPSGKVVNNEASSELSPTEYLKLWDSNKLDMILYYWTCAIYLVRIHCNF